MGFPRQDYQSRLPFPSTRNLPNSGIKSASPTSPALTGNFCTTEPPKLKKQKDESYFNFQKRVVKIIGSIFHHGNIETFTAAAAKSLQLCPTLCDPIDDSPPGAPIPGILQARTLEWVAISFSNAWKWKVKAKSFSHVWLFTTPWTAAHQAPPSMGFSRQEYWSGVPLPSPWNFHLRCQTLLA